MFYMQPNFDTDIEKMIRSKNVRKATREAEEIFYDIGRITGRIDAAYQIMEDAIEGIEDCYSRLVAMYGEDRLIETGIKDMYETDTLSMMERAYEAIGEARMKPVKLSQRCFQGI